MKLFYWLKFIYLGIEGYDGWQVELQVLRGEQSCS